ncbi:Piso0_005202 [Millerozyma farinosa CBS 7064]|uniref:Piso0_005202 protein n=1 Tax=Pichia sorbitophila (strain ATCC MYA-4447 / BCRC 22081 / CBS 7064 / NBRC 10061 / NRRL Y-12695) TaxID=559304 RepID=G8Y1J4_PICSO|nr:Piso0_005202 [Millerozyma farinosa CBS 7064]
MNNNPNQVITSMMQNQHMTNPLMQQHGHGQGQQQNPQPGFSQNTKQTPQQMMAQNPSMVPFAQHQLSVPNNGHMNGQINGQVNGQVNGIPSQLAAQSVMQNQNQPPSQHRTIQQRPGMPRSATIQQVNTINNQAHMSDISHADPAFPGPNSAPVPGTNGQSSIQSQSQAHSHQLQQGLQPQMQPHISPQGLQQNQKINGPMSTNITPVIPQQQQPTPQSQPRMASAFQQNASMQRSVPMSMRVQSLSPMQKPLAGGGSQFVRGQEQEELNSKIYKRNLGNAGLFRIINLIDMISNESINNLSKIEYWQNIVSIYASPSCVLKLTTPPVPTMGGISPNMNNPTSFALDKGPTGAPKQYELAGVSIPRLAVAHLQANDTTNFTIALPGLKFQVMNNGSIFLLSKLALQFTYMDGSIAHINGACRMLLNGAFRIEWIDCRCMEYKATVSIEGLEKQWGNLLLGHSLGQPDDMMNRLRERLVATRVAKSSGFAPDVMRLVQVGDIFSHLRALIGFSAANNLTSPLKAIELFSSTINQQPNAANSTTVKNTSLKSPYIASSDNVRTFNRKRASSSAQSSGGSPLSFENGNLKTQRKK